MDPKVIEQFISAGTELYNQFLKRKRELSASGIYGVSSMPAGMHEWISDIKIFTKRYLTNHPLYDDMKSALFHNRNSVGDYEKITGLLRALLKDIVSPDNDIVQNQEQAVVKSAPIYLMPNWLPQNSRSLLKEIVESDNPTDMICNKFEKSSPQEDEVLRSILRELIDKGYINIPVWADDVPSYIQINNSARTYDEQEREFIRMGKTNNRDKELKDYDVFISHANSDKSRYVKELVSTIRKLGIDIFYDEDVLSWGDNWKDTILRGTEKSEFAIIVISDSFFGREWTERELSEFLQRQNKMNQKIVLPLLHNISFEQLKEKYPELQYIQSIRSEEYPMELIAILLAKELIKRYK